MKIDESRMKIAKIEKIVVRKFRNSENGAEKSR